MLQDNPYLRYKDLKNIENSLLVDTLLVTESEFTLDYDGLSKIEIDGFLKNGDRRRRGLNYDSVNGQNQFEIERKVIDSTLINGQISPMVQVFKHKSSDITHIYPVKDQEYIEREIRGLYMDITIFLLIVPLHFFLRIILFTIKFIKNGN